MSRMRLSGGRFFFFQAEDGIRDLTVTGVQTCGSSDLLDGFVDALATRIASFDKRAIIDTKRLVNAASLPPDVEIAAGWDACLASMGRPAAQERIKTLMARGFHKPGDAENRLGYYVGQLGR